MENNNIIEGLRILIQQYEKERFRERVRNGIKTSKTNYEERKEK